MPFNKTGSFQIIAGRVESPADWKDFLTSNENLLYPSDGGGVRLASSDALTKAGNAVATIKDPDQWIFVHATIMASVDLEDGSDHLLRKASEKWINDNGDCWEREQLLKDFGTFRNASVYVEHNQHPEHAKGKVFDVVAREMDDTFLVDVLFGIQKRHTDLVANIEAGILNTVSMGCSTAFTKCSCCGNIAHTENDYCSHIKDQKRQQVAASDGQMRKAAELCFDNNFFDCSIVASPAFSGAVFRRLVANNEALRAMMERMVCSRIDADPQDFEKELRKAASVITQLEKEVGSTASDSLILKEGSRLVSTLRGGGMVASVGESAVNIEWDGGETSAVSVKDIEPSAKERILVAAVDASDPSNAGYHPINNKETQKHDYGIEAYGDFSDIPTTSNRGKTHSIDAYNAHNPLTKLEGTVYEGFDASQVRLKIADSRLHRRHRCPSCKSVGLEMLRRAASIDKGAGDTLLCEQCGAADASAFSEQRSYDFVSRSPDLVLACRTAALMDNPSFRTAFLNFSAAREAKNAGLPVSHVSDAVRQTVRKIGVELGKLPPTLPKEPAKTAFLREIAHRNGNVITTHDVVVSCPDGRDSDAAAVHLASEGIAVVAADRDTDTFCNWEKTLRQRFRQNGKWSQMRLLALSGKPGRMAQDRVFKAWSDAQAAGNPLSESGELSDDDRMGMTPEEYDVWLDQRAEDAGDYQKSEDRDFHMAKQAGYLKWEQIWEGLGLPDTTESRRKAAAELVRITDSRRVNIRIEASRKVSRILQEFPSLTVKQAKAVLWYDLCEYMPAQDAGYLVNKVIDVKTNDQFGLGRNMPLDDAREPADEPGVARTMRASGGTGA